MTSIQILCQDYIVNLSFQVTTFSHTPSLYTNHMLTGKNLAPCIHMYAIYNQISQIFIEKFC